MRGTRLPRLALGLVLALPLAACAGTWGGPSEPTLRTAAAATDIALLAVDASQSRWMADHYASAHLSERNVLLGSYPSKAALTAYCAAWAGGVAAARAWLPRRYAWAVIGAVAVLEVWTVEVNYRFGEGPSL